MAAIKGTKAKLLVDEFDFSCQTNSASVELQTSEAECTVFCSEGQEFEPLLGAMRITQNGYFVSTTASYVEKELHDRLGVGGVTVAAILGTDVVGCPVYVIGDAFGVNMSIDAPTNGLITIAGGYTNRLSSGHRGIRVFDGAISATGGTASVDLGAAGSAGGIAYLFVQSITGTAANAAVNVEHSSNNSSFTSKGTATFSAVGVYEVALTGTVSRYIRLNCTDLGGATSFVVVGVIVVTGVTEN